MMYVDPSGEAEPRVFAQHGVVAELSGVSKTYRRVHALKSVSLQVRAGRVVAILGPNGAGKSTAVSLLMGLLRPTQGRARLFGGDPRDLQARARIGAMLQVSGVPATLKVREHVHQFASYYPRPLSVHETLQIAGLTDVVDQPYGKLSGGQRRRLEFALAICGDPELLFLDEPTVGLDIESRRAFWRHIRSLAATGRTVVLTTHYLEEADALANDIIVINGGEIIAQGTPEEIKQRTAGHRIVCKTVLDKDAIRAFKGVDSVTHDGPWVQILATRAEPVVLQLLTHDPQLTNLEVTRSRLEEAFLNLTKTTGKTLVTKRV